jgi:hypothetical protein
MERLYEEKNMKNTSSKYTSGIDNEYQFGKLQEELDKFYDDLEDELNSW